MTGWTLTEVRQLTMNELAEYHKTAVQVLSEATKKRGR